MKKLALLLIAFTLPLAAQQGFYLNPVVSTESGGLFNAAAEVSTTMDLSVGAGAQSATLAIQAFAAGGPSACTYTLQGSLKSASDTPIGTDFVNLTIPTALSCMTANDERLHFLDVRNIRSLRVTLTTLTGGTGVVFIVFGMAK